MRFRAAAQPLTPAISPRPPTTSAITANVLPSSSPAAAGATATSLAATSAIAWDLGHAWVAAVVLLVGAQVIALRAMLATPNHTSEVTADSVL